MPRNVREKSNTGIYHIMLKGINGQVIFEDDEDYERFLQTIMEYRDKCGFTVYAFCIMSNHIHLLLKEGEEELGIIFRRIGASYVYWYNWKYKRNGPLFQDRFKSEAVEDDTYLLNVIRYIHQNPVKAGIEKEILKYKWSSYKEYLNSAKICHTKVPLGLFSTNDQTAIGLFTRFNEEENNDKYLDYEQKIRIDDKEAIRIIKETFQVENSKEIQNFEKNQRNIAIKQLKDEGLSIRQISRLTGVCINIIKYL